MAQKKTAKARKSAGRRLWQWIRSHKLSAGAGGVLIAALAAYQSYAGAGADSLRRDIYEPLYREIGGMEQSLEANSLQRDFSSQTFELLKQSGSLARIPKSLREKIVQLYQKASEARSHLSSVTLKVYVMMPSKVSSIRTEADNKAWTEKTLAQLNATSGPSAALPPMFSLSFSARHAAMSPVIDFRDPQHPRIAKPGIVPWQVTDWLKFPQSASDIQDSWPMAWFLGFDERNESWYYLITQDDLARNRMSLKDFIKPAYDELSRDPDFQQLLESNRSALALLRQVKSLLAARVQQPKQLRDLID